MAERVRVVLIEPVPLIREGLALFVDTQPDLDVAAAVATLEEGVEHIERLGDSDDVLVVVEIDRRGSVSTRLVGGLRERFGSITIVATAIDAERSAISQAIADGADSYVDKRADPVEFLDSLRRAVRGETTISGMPPLSGDGARGPLPLTARQLEVLTLAAEGLTDRQIGGRLGLTERTVSAHLLRIYKRLGVSGRVAAVRQAVGRGMLPDS